VQNCSSEKKICIFTHISDICNIDSKVLSSGFPHIHIVLCAIDLSHCSCFFIDLLASLVESSIIFLSYALVNCMSL